MKEIKFIIFILIIFINSINVNGQSSVIKEYTNLDGTLDDGSMGLIPSDAQIALINENGICRAVNPISDISFIHVGWTNSDAIPITYKNVTFLVTAPMELSQSLEVNVNSTVEFNIPIGGDDTVDAKIKIKESTSIMRNFGSISSKTSTVYITYGLLENTGYLNVNKITNDNGFFVAKQDSITSLASFDALNGLSTLQGTITFASGSTDDKLFLSQGSETEFKQASVINRLEVTQILGSSNLLLSGQSTFESNRNDYTKGSIDVFDQSSVKLEQRSVMDLLNVTLNIRNSVNFNITSVSSLQTDSLVKLSSNANVKLEQQSTLISSAPLLIDDNSQISIESSSTMESKLLYLSNQSKLNVDYSTLTVGKSSNDRGGSGSTSSGSSDDGSNDEAPNGRSFLGLQHTSELTLANSSQLNIAGPFGLINSTIVSVDSSSVNISKSFYQFDKSSVSSVNSTFDISNSFNVNDLSSFSFIDSTVSVSGSFEINSDKLNVQREFKSSTINVDGKFINIGATLLFNKTNFQVNKDLTSIGIVNSIESNINVNKGQFNVGGKYIGENDKINLENGQMTIASKSNFECTGCTINSVGEIVQAKSSKLKLSDSTINNSGTGIIEISGDIILDKTSKLTNSGTGKFKLQANINDDGLGLDGAKVDNKGTFEILDNGNGVGNNTEINVQFDNSGTLSITQNSNFKKLSQQNGLLNLVNNAEIYSKSSIDLTGGNIVGKGTINATVNLSENSILGHNTNVTSIIIVGNYTQSINTTVIITIDSMEDFSTIGIMGEIITLNGGTLIIRMNSEMVNNPKNYNKSMSFMASVSNSNSGNNNNNLEAASGSSSTSTGRGAEMTGDFTKIQFKTYTPGIDGDEEVVDECKYQMQKSSTSLSLLLGSSCEQVKNGLTTPQIIGIAFAAFGAVVVAGLVTTYIVFTKYRYSPRSISLKKWVTKKF